MKDEHFILKLGLILLSITGIVVLILIGINVRTKYMINLQKTYIASHDILPRTKISENDLLEIYVPYEYIGEYTYNTKEEIVGKYTEIQGMIPAGSCFYKTMLYSEKDLPDYPSAQLRSGQAAFTLETDFTKLGGTLVAGQRVDIHVTIDRRQDTPITGCLIENARIVAIKDHKGLDLDDESSTGVPFIVIVAINQDDVPVLSKANTMGSIRLFSTSNTYNTSSEAILVKDAEVLKYLRDEIISE